MISIKVKTKYGEQFIVLDKEDYDIIQKYELRLRLTKDRTRKDDIFYVTLCKTVKGKTFRKLLHRVLTSCPDGLVVDHINGNPLDNRKCNLRIVTQIQNMQNPNKYNYENVKQIIDNSYIVERNKPTNIKKSGVKGVKWNKMSNKWEVGFRVNGKYKYIGVYPTLEEAIKIRMQYD